MRVSRVDVHDRYLGLPVVLGCKKSECFAHIKDRLWKKLKGWKDKLLSAAGKEILIKVVGQSLPIYSMNCFLLPKAFCEELQSILCRFWWGDNESSRRIHWLSWDNICRPNKEGGLGFQVLRLPGCSKPNTSRITLFGSALGPSPSACWRGMLAARPILERGSRWRVGDGRSISIWQANLYGTGSPRLSIPFLPLNVAYF